MHPGRSFLLGGSLTLLLAACSQPQMQQPAQTDPYANGASFPWSYTAPADRLTPLTLTPGENTLQYEPVLAAKNGWGPIEVNHSNGEQAAGDGKTLSINGKTYARGFGTHAGSELRFSLKGTGATCNRFTADVGVDDEVGPRGKVVFQVYLDGVKAYDSGVMKGKDPAKRVDLDITGKQELRLVVTDGGNGINYDHADWADPKIYCQATNTTPNVQIALNPQDLTIFHKQRATVRATFTPSMNFSGPLDLQLAKEPGVGVFEDAFKLELLTTRINLTGSGPQTYDLVISAPNPLTNNYPDYNGPFRLTASSAGRDVGSALININVRPLAVKARFEPASVSGRNGETKRVTVVVTIDPPIDGPVPLQVGFATGSPDENEFSRIVNVSPSRGDGATMRADVDFRFFDTPELPDDRTYEVENLIVYVGDIAGYRVPGYGRNLEAPLEMKLIR